MAYHKCASIYGTNNSAASVQTASGAIANFNTKLAMPLKFAKFNFEATGGGGTPSTPIPIEGVSEVKAGHCKKNLFNIGVDESLPAPTDLLISPRVLQPYKLYKGLRSDNYYFANYISYTRENNAITVNNLSSNAQYGVLFCLPCNGGATYSISLVCTSPLYSIGYYDKNWNYLSQTTTYTSTSQSITIPNNARYMGLCLRASANSSATYSNIQVEEGVSATEYEPFNGNAYNILFPPYSENLPYFEGLLAGTHAFVDLSDLAYSFVSQDRWESLSIRENVLRPSAGNVKANIICNTFDTYSTYEIYSDLTLNGIAVAQNGIMYVRNGSTTDTPTGFIIYELAEPITPTITPEQLQTLLRAFAGVYYGGYVEQDKDGHRKLKVLTVKKKLSDYAWAKGDLNVDGRIFYHNFSNETVEPSVNCKCNSFEQVAWGNWNVLTKYQYMSASYFVFCVEDNYATVRDMLAVYGDVEFTAILKTPYYIPLPNGTSIKTLPGVNNIYADTGDIEVSYKKLA